jgi:hypothetical protein
MQGMSSTFAKDFKLFFLFKHNRIHLQVLPAVKPMLPLLSSTLFKHNCSYLGPQLSICLNACGTVVLLVKKKNPRRSGGCLYRLAREAETYLE